MTMIFIFLAVYKEECVLSKNHPRKTTQKGMPHQLTTFVKAATQFDPATALLPFTVAGTRIGWLKPAFAQHLQAWPEYFSVRERGVGMLGTAETADERSAILGEVIEVLAEGNIIDGWRGEQVAVAESFYSPTLFHIERAASRYFGFTMFACHLNGITTRNGVPHMWLAKRAATKHQDPGMLDNLVAGRIARGFTPAETIIKESFEEAGIVGAIISQLRAVGALKSCRPVDEGLHEEVMFAYDIALPEHFTPQNQDGEVAEFLCVSIPHLMGMLEHGAQFTIDAALVMVDFLIRHGHIDAARDDYLDLIHMLRP
jgi:8-oxo-dGTP pyrophosphatase MutT (NUDIX family)